MQVSLAADLRRSIEPPADAAGNTVAKGASIVILWRLVDRLISLVSTPVLARLLAPDDFGLVAMATLAAGLVGVFTDLGVNAALIQQRSPTAEHYDSGWTLRLCQTTVMALIVFGVSWPAAAYFGDPRLVAVLHVSALTTLVGGLENIGIVLLQKHLQFRREMRFFLARRLVGFAITMAFAFAFRSYWAIVLGALAGQLAAVALSYVMHPYRPRFCLKRGREILSFSQWSLVRGIGAYVSNSVPSILLGRRAGAGELGIFRAGSEIANLGAGEILAPLARVLYPALVNARDSTDGFRRAVSLALSVQFMVTLPACVGLALVSQDAVAVLLGSKWEAAAPVVALLALSSCFVVFHHTGGYALMAVGRIRVQSLMMWLDAILFLIPAIILGVATPLAIAGIRLVSTTVISWSFAYLLTQPAIGLRWSQILGSFVRPVLGCMAMAIAVLGVGILLPGPSLLILLCKVLTGAGAYVIAVGAVWLASGRHEGAESYLFDKASGAFTGLRFRFWSSR